MDENLPYVEASQKDIGMCVNSFKLALPSSLEPTLRQMQSGKSDTNFDILLKTQTSSQVFQIEVKFH